jgi:hypothetical protein
VAELLEVVVVGAYLVLMLAIGFWASKKIKGCEDQPFSRWEERKTKRDDRPTSNEGLCTE